VKGSEGDLLPVSVCVCHYQTSYIQTVDEFLGIVMKPSEEWILLGQNSNHIFSLYLESPILNVTANTGYTLPKYKKV